jgi:hypothetical protein
MTLSARMRESLGGVIPVWFPDSMPAEDMLGFLSYTLEDAELFVAPARLVLVVDGCPAAVAPARQAAEQLGRRAGAEPTVMATDCNAGKGGAVCTGFERLLQDDAVEALNVRDCDGDHDIYDLPQLYRLFEQMRRQEGTDDVFVVGCRGSLTRPLGFARGQNEDMLNRLTMGSVNQRLADEGRAVDERYTGRYGCAPDFQSGYKVYSRSAARVVVDSLRAADQAEPDLEVMRWAVEFIPTVELLLRGFIPGALHRLTYDGQPQTTFDESDLPRAYSKQITWLFRRLDLPYEAGRCLLDNALAASEYVTAARGAEHLAALREQVMQECYPGHAGGSVARGGDFV